MNPHPDDLSRAERAALRRLREQVRQQQRAARNAEKKDPPPTPAKPKEPCT